jgi:hypothetical protein
MRLDKSKFIAWLKTKEPDEIVGENRSSCGCPIAKFYHDASGGSEVSIYERLETGYMIDRGYSKQPLPMWAAHFVFTVDGNGDRKITAQHALSILDETR